MDLPPRKRAAVGICKRHEQLDLIRRAPQVPGWTEIPASVWGQLWDLRHLAVGRNNWTIFGNPRGGEVACRLYSLVLSCQESEVDPQAYLEVVLGRIQTTPISELATLTPWGWKAARAEVDVETRG